MYEAKGILTHADNGVKKRYDSLIQEYFNNQTTFYARTPKMQWDDVWYDFFARVTRNDQVGPITSTDDIVGGKSGRIELISKLRQYRGAVAIEDARVLTAKYNGVGKLASAWASELEDTMFDMNKDLNEAFFGTTVTGSFGDPVDGLRGLLAASGNVYGQSRSTYEALQANVKTSQGDLTISDFRDYVVELKKNGADKSKLVAYTTPEIQADMLNKAEANKMYIGTSSALGFEGMPTIDGILIVDDSDCPEGYMFILHQPDYKIVEFVKPSLGKPLGKTNLTETKYVWAILNLVFTKFNTHYNISGITV